VKNFISVCSGIEAASVAWHPLGWTAAAFAEIEKFPSAVLAHHYPTVPNRGDMTKFKDWPDESIDLLVGGTPCQAFSVAGLRKGLDDPRGNLTLTFLALARKYRPEWVVWENVPGVLSDRTNAFGQFLAGLGQLGYGWAYRVLDAQYFGVAQRRRRVFVVANLRDWRRAAAVLFERESLRGDSAPSREPREGIAGTLSARTEGGGGLGTDFDLSGGVIAADVAPTLNAHFGAKQGLENQHIDGGGACSLPLTARALTTKNQRNDAETETLLPMRRGGFFDGPTHALKGEGHDASEDGTGRGVPIVTTLAIRGRDGQPTLETRSDGTANAILTPNGGRGGTGCGEVAIQERAICENPNAGPDGVGIRTDDTAYTLEARQVPQAVAFSAKDSGADAGPLCPTLRAGGHAGSHANGGVMPAVAFSNSAGDTALGMSLPGVPPITRRNGDPGNVLSGMTVRRLTPRECERLQGFPDDYTLIPWRGKPAPDGPRYKALGNSMAVPVMAWIGRRIKAVENLK
jgi:DNA (cytosine-5)-methyltransferase 1